MKSLLCTFLHRSVPLAVAVVVAMAAWGCDWPPTFGPEYYNTGTNYIAALPLAAPPPASDDGSTVAQDPSAVALDSSARWDWSWRGKPATGNAYEYMSLTPMDATNAAATDDGYTLASGAPVWRLELSNLFLNGDFETGLDMSAFDKSINSTFGISAVTPIHGNSLDIDIGNEVDDYVYFHMDKLLDDIATTAVGGTYQLRMLLGNPVIFNFRDALPTEIGASTTLTATPDETGSLFITQRFTGFDQNYVFVVVTENDKVTLDEVRAVRTDIEPYLRLLLDPADTSPTLVKGQYEFSVWMRTSEADKAFNDASRIDQPYAARNATLRLRQVAYSLDAATGLGSLDPTVSSTTTVAVDSTWRRFAVRLEKPNNMEDFDEGTPHPVLELAIAPTLEDPMDAGAVLIAAPELNFYIRGF